MANKNRKTLRGLLQESALAAIDDSGIQNVDVLHCVTQGKNNFTKEPTLKVATEGTSGATKEVATGATTEDPLGYLTAIQRAVLFWLCRDDTPAILNRKTISEATGVKLNTIRTVIYRLKKLGLIDTKYYGKGIIKGMKVHIPSSTKHDVSISISLEKYEDRNNNEE